MSIQSVVKSPLPAGRERSGLRRWGGPHAAGVTALTALIAGIYSVFALVNYAMFRDSSYDLVIFDEAVRSYAHFHPAISVIKGVHNGFGPHFSELGDHFSPILAALAPLYWLDNGPQNLLIAQAVLFALAIPPLWVFTRRAFSGGGWKATMAAYLVCAAYGLSWPIATAVNFDFHEVAFAPVLTAIALERFQAGRLRTALIALAGLLLVKEDMGLLVAGIGLALIISFSPTVRRQRLVGGGLVVAGLAWSAIATYVLIPAFGGRSDYYFAYTALGNNVPQVIVHVIRHPVSTLRLLVTPHTKLHTMKWLFSAFCFLSVLSPLVVAALPLLAERMLNSRYHDWWADHYQYNAYLVIILACAAVEGSARIDRWVTRAWAAYQARRTAPAVARAGASGPAGEGDLTAPGGEPAGLADTTIDGAPPAAVTGAKGLRPGTGVAALVCCLAIFGATMYSLPKFPLGAALHARFYEQTAKTRAEAAADAAVPSGVVVEAANDLGPQLSGRDTVLLWDGEHAPLGTPWIVADVRGRELTFTGVAAERARVALLVKSGYKIVFQRDGYLVLHRDKPGGPLANSQEASG
jgi:uncharacterized membrane protein